MGPQGCVLLCPEAHGPLFMLSGLVPLKEKIPFGGLSSPFKADFHSTFVASESAGVSPFPNERHLMASLPNVRLADFRLHVLVTLWGQLGILCASLTVLLSGRIPLLLKFLPMLHSHSLSF